MRFVEGASPAVVKPFVPRHSRGLTRRRRQDPARRRCPVFRSPAGGGWRGKAGYAGIRTQSCRRSRRLREGTNPDDPAGPCFRIVLVEDRTALAEPPQRLLQGNARQRDADPPADAASHGEADPGLDSDGPQNLADLRIADIDEKQPLLEIDLHRRHGHRGA